MDLLVFFHQIIETELAHENRSENKAAEKSPNTVYPGKNTLDSVLAYSKETILFSENQFNRTPVDGVFY